MTHEGTQSAAKKECIELCRECAESCIEMINHCLGEGGKHAEQKHIALLQTCADICDTSARAMLFGSEQDTEICDACASICDACADDCEKFQDDKDMAECADTCRRCADSCRAMAGTTQNREKSYKKTEASPTATI